MNNASPTNAAGRVNSLASTFSSVMRLFAPVIATSLFAYTANLDAHYPLNYFFVFHFNAIMCVVAVLISIALPAGVSRFRINS
jgi:hypothetical protein